jgi:hypothetical protein
MPKEHVETSKVGSEAKWDNGSNNAKDEKPHNKGIIYRTRGQGTALL